MNFLITGGAGSVGRDLTASLLLHGHRVKVLDNRVETLAVRSEKNLELIAGRVEDEELVRSALKDVEAVIHLAWSFSDDPLTLIESDLKGHAILLNACAAANVSRLFYASSAVVYGRPADRPITEDAPCPAEDARKPFYAAAKLAAEKLALAYGKVKGLPVTIFRFWWSYGREIGGRHLRDMIACARAGEALTVPEGAGGSFLDHDDLTTALLHALRRKESIGQVFNLATLYLPWSEIARMIIDAAGSSSPLEVIPAAEWKGAQFLADPWELSVAKAERLFDYRSRYPRSIARERLGQAIERGCEGIGSKTRA